jgi:hypothetical protein
MCKGQNCNCTIFMTLWNHSQCRTIQFNPLTLWLRKLVSRRIVICLRLCRMLGAQTRFKPGIHYFLYSAVFTRLMWKNLIKFSDSQTLYVMGLMTQSALLLKIHILICFKFNLSVLCCSYSLFILKRQHGLKMCVLNSGK